MGLGNESSIEATNSLKMLGVVIVAHTSGSSENTVQSPRIPFHHEVFRD